MRPETAIKNERSKSIAKKVGVVLVSMAALTGCFNLRGDMLAIQVSGPTSLRATVRRHATRDIVALSPGRNDNERGKKGAGILRTGADLADVNGWARNRWNAATAPDQYSDIGLAIRQVGSQNRCLTVTMKVGWGNIGYNWSHTAFNPNNACKWGQDPLPDVP